MCFITKTKTNKKKRQKQTLKSFQKKCLQEEFQLKLLKTVYGFLFIVLYSINEQLLFHFKRSFGLSISAAVQQEK